jgi:hypothetical protein
MKLLDPLQGLTTIVTCIAFQFVFSAASLTALIRYWTSYDIPISKEASAINRIALELFIGHVVVYILWVLPMCAKRLSPHAWRIFKRICEALSVLSYLRTIFVACTEFPGALNAIRETKVIDQDAVRNLAYWIQLEIRVFFSLIIMAIAFLMFSLMRRPNNIMKKMG